MQTLEVGFTWKDLYSHRDLHALLMHRSVGPTDTYITNLILPV